MKRLILALTLGILCAALCVSAISVYVFHDVDHDQIGHWNQAFGYACQESTAFAIIISGATGLLTLLGRVLLRRKHISLRLGRAFFLGIGVSVFQYPWDFVTRALFPAFAQASLLIYMSIAPIACAIFFLRISRRENTSGPPRELGQADS
jgi:hypothetical protein